METLVTMVDGRRAEIRECCDDCIIGEVGTSAELYRDGVWRDDWTYGSDLWPTREAAEEFLAKHADKTHVPSETELSESIGAAAYDQEAIAAMERVRVEPPVAVRQVTCHKIGCSNQASHFICACDEHITEISEACLVEDTKPAPQDQRADALSFAVRDFCADIIGGSDQEADLAARAAFGGDPMKAIELAQRHLEAERQRADGLCRLVGFFVSVIKCGEPWTDTCQHELDLAMSPATREQLAAVSAPPAKE